jgi:hypothetical protein
MSQTLIICETCRNPQCYCTCKNAPSSVQSTALLDAVDRLVAEQDKVVESRGLCNTEKRKLAMFDLIELRRNQKASNTEVSGGRSTSAGLTGSQEDRT